jgi:hypothetical protein
MDQETKVYLCKQGIGEQLFSDIEALQLGNTTLLKQVTYKDLAGVMPRAKARYIHDKLFPPQPLSTNIEAFLNECGIDHKYHVFFQRLQLTSMEMIHYVDLTHLLESGMETIHADIIVKMIKARLNNITIISDGEEEQVRASPKKRPQKKRSSLSTLKKRRYKKRKKWPIVPQKSSENTFNGFLSAKGLHIGPFTKEKFKDLYRKFKLRRQRFGRDKWTYSYNYDGSDKEVQAGLKHVLDILWNIEQKEAVAYPIEPIEPAEPVEPVEPVEPAEPIEPVELDDERV